MKQITCIVSKRWVRLSYDNIFVEFDRDGWLKYQQRMFWHEVRETSQKYTIIICFELYMR